MEHEGAGGGILHALEMSPLGEVMRQSPVVYPAVETLHIVGFSLLVGAIVAFDLRVLGVARSLPADRVAGLLLPVAVAGFLLAAPMGVLLFATEATSIARNPSFLAKMTLLALAAVNIAVFHLGAGRAISAWAGGPAPPAARVGAVVSAMLWIGVIAGGRLIAYF